MPVLPQNIADLVAQDGIARQVTADDGSQHMLYLDGRFVRSALLADWPAAQTELAQHDQDRADAAAARAALRTRLQSAVGVQLDDLTTPQMKALLAYLIRREGGLTNDLRIKPLAEWEKA